MSVQRFSLALCRVLLMLAVLLSMTLVQAADEKVLHSFAGGSGSSSDGRGPIGGVIFDSAGNLYGATYVGGIHDGGVAFELLPNGDGGWTETVIHSFGAGSDGFGPWDGMVMDSNGNLYGTTEGGGIHGGGTVFEITP